MGIHSVGAQGPPLVSLHNRDVLESTQKNLLASNGLGPRLGNPFCESCVHHEICFQTNTNPSGVQTPCLPSPSEARKESPLGKESARIAVEHETRRLPARAAPRPRRALPSQIGG
ncbi:hypothetical protein MRX96_002591 [Rhipicephalus microplus]